MAKVKHSDLLNVGDITAPVGSAAWCIGVREEAQATLRNTKTTREQAREWVNALRKDNRFRELKDADGRHFLAWEAFCAASPPYGFGCTPEELEALIEAKPRAQVLAADPDVRPAASPGAPLGNQNARKGDLTADEEIAENKGSNATVVSPQDRGAAYLVRRLKRDAPEIAADLAAGKYKSARSAGIAAGIVRTTPTLNAVKKDAAKLPPDERAELLAWLSDLCREDMKQGA